MSGAKVGDKTMMDALIPASRTIAAFQGDGEAALFAAAARAADLQLHPHRGALLNIANASLSYQEQKLSLSKNDLRILQVLLENQGNVVSRETLMQRLWETNSFIDENTLSVNVARLRKKLDALGLTDFIITKKGLGYLVP